MRHEPAVVLPNDDTGWLGREPTSDEQDVVAWMKRKRLPDTILHVGVGSCLLSREFGPRVKQGLSRDGGEVVNGATLGLDMLLCNKYDVLSYGAALRDPFDCIVDVNIRSYACCDDHFRKYMGRMSLALTANGMLLTSRSGLEYLVPTSTSELRRLCPDWTIRTSGSIVVMRPRLKIRIRKWLGARNARTRSVARSE